jgi:hypothetical protein
MVDNGNTLEVLVTVDDSDTYNQVPLILNQLAKAGAQEDA